MGSERKYSTVIPSLVPIQETPTVQMALLLSRVCCSAAIGYIGLICRSRPDFFGLRSADDLPTHPSLFQTENRNAMKRCNEWTLWLFSGHPALIRNVMLCIHNPVLKMLKTLCSSRQSRIAIFGHTPPGTREMLTGVRSTSPFNNLKSKCWCKRPKKSEFGANKPGSNQQSPSNFCFKFQKQLHLASASRKHAPQFTINAKRLTTAPCDSLWRTQEPQEPIGNQNPLGIRNGNPWWKLTQTSVDIGDLIFTYL